MYFAMPSKVTSSRSCSHSFFSSRWCPVLLSNRNPILSINLWIPLNDSINKTILHVHYKIQWTPTQAGNNYYSIILKITTRKGGLLPSSAPSVAPQLWLLPSVSFSFSVRYPIWNEDDLQQICLAHRNHLWCTSWYRKNINVSEIFNVNTLIVHIIDNCLAKLKQNVWCKEIIHSIRVNKRKTLFNHDYTTQTAE